MPSSYSPLLRIELQASGENDTTWGDKTNSNYTNVLEAAIAGMSVISLADANYALSVNSGSADEARSAILVVQGTITAQRDITIPSLTKTYIVRNTCAFPVSIKTAAGTGVLVSNGTTSYVYCDGVNVHSASSPTSDASITPSKIDSSVANAWRFGGAVGIGRAQSYTAGYGWLGIDGTTGARTTYYISGASKGEINATATTFDVAAAPGVPLTLSTNSFVRVTISDAGSVSMSGALLLGGALSGTSAAFSAGGTFGGVVSAAGGFSGITAANVRTALGYTAVQQGTGVNQSPSFAVKLGWNSSLSKLRATVETTDLGNVMFENTPNIFIPVTGGNALYDFASNSIGTAYTSAIQFRETGHAGVQNNSMAAAPGFALHWSGVAASQIKLQPNAIISFINNPGTAQESIYANTGYFTGDVIAFYSDMRLKTKVGNIDGARAIVRKLSGFRYTENDKARALGYNSDRVQIGLSAQEVKEVLPELIELAPADCEAVPGSAGKWVSKSGQNYMTVNYARMVPVLVEAIKEQDDMILTLQEQVARYQTTLVEVMSRLSLLEAK